MCLIGLAWRHHPHYQLVLAGNRDEYFARPSAALDWWAAPSAILAGRDLQGGGSWLGVTRTGRLAAVTNYREPNVARRADAPSRGALVAGFLASSQSLGDYLESISDEGALYSGFNLLVATGLATTHAALWVASNRDPATPQPVAPGIHGLSNGNFDEAWPKVVAIQGVLARRLAGPAAADPAELAEALIADLSDEHAARDEMLPASGVSMELERLLSPAFVRMPGYGTRASSVVLVDQLGTVDFVERSFDEHGSAQTVSMRFELG